METKEYFEKVMQDFNQNRRGRNLRKYCSDEGIDYKWLSEYKKQYSSTKGKVEKEEAPSLIPLQVIDERFSEQPVVQSEVTPNKSYLFWHGCFLVCLEYSCYFIQE